MTFPMKYRGFLQIVRQTNHPRGRARSASDPTKVGDPAIFLPVSFIFHMFEAFEA
jgi:hypothetical protein